MNEKRKASFQDVGEELDRRLGGLLGEVGATLGEVLGRLDQMGDGEIVRERDFEIDRGAVRAGIRVRVGGLGATERSAENPSSESRAHEPYDPKRNADDQAQAPRESTPSNDCRAIEATILTIDGTWTLLADLPGVDLADVKLGDTGRGRQLVLSAAGRHRRYAGRFDLPDGLSADDLTVNLVNGILELHAQVPSK